MLFHGAHREVKASPEAWLQFRLSLRATPPTRCRSARISSGDCSERGGLHTRAVPRSHRIAAVFRVDSDVPRTISLRCEESTIGHSCWQPPPPAALEVGCPRTQPDPEGRKAGVVESVAAKACETGGEFGHVVAPVPWTAQSAIGTTRAGLPAPAGSGLSPSGSRSQAR